MECTKAILAGLFCVMAEGVSAEQATGWYVGYGLGQTKFADVGCSDSYSAVFADISCSDDNKGTGWKVFAGHQVMPKAAFEFGVARLGEATIDGTDSFFGETDAQSEADLVYVAGVGSIPLGNSTSLLAKLGLFMWRADLAIDTRLGGASEDDSGIDVMFGFGAAFNLGGNFTLRVEWERFSDVGDDATTGQTDIDMLSASILLHL